MYLRTHSNCLVNTEGEPGACGPTAVTEELVSRLEWVPHQPVQTAPFTDQSQPIDSHGDRMKSSANDSKNPNRPRPDAINPAFLLRP